MSDTAPSWEQLKAMLHADASDELKVPVVAAMPFKHGLHGVETSETEALKRWGKNPWYNSMLKVNLDELFECHSELGDDYVW